MEGAPVLQATTGRRPGRAHATLLGFIYARAA